MYFQLAWRNIWRNPRRTFVIITAVVIGVWSMVFLSAFSRGMLASMLDNGKSVLIGDIQIHNKKYRVDPSIDNSVDHPDKIRAVLDITLPEGAVLTERIKVSAYMSNARHSAGAVLVGIDPENEKKISFIGRSVVRGEYLDQTDKHGILVGEALLEKFDTKIGKKLIVMARNKKGRVASRAFRIRGVFNAEMEATEKQFIFITMTGARKLLNMGKGVSEISIVLNSEPMVEKTAAELRKRLGTEFFAIETWKDLLPMLKAYVEIFNGFMYIWYVVVFVAMGFGIVNTSLMAVFERVREFGLLRALGLKPWSVIRSVLTESIFIILTGIIVGNLLGYLSILLMEDSGLDLAMFGKGSEFFGMSRVIYPILTMFDVMNVNLVIFLLGAVVSLYPAFRASRITPVEAMRQ